MKKNTLFYLVLVICAAFVFAIEQTEMQNKILESLMEESPKEAFKAWHQLYKKDYDYNTEAGLQKFKNFKQNLENIKKINSGPANTWKAGLNENSDKSYEELAAYYNLKPFQPDEIRRDIEKANKSKGFTLDDYSDDDDSDKKKDDPPVPPKKRVGVALYDYRSYFLGVRNQGSCGSCWAFATAGQVEATYWKQHAGECGAVNQYLSPQQLVDCETTSYGCGGGFPSYAMTHWMTKYPMAETDYVYKAVQGTCTESSKTTAVRVNGVKYAGTYYKGYTSYATYDLLANGPVVILVGAFSDFSYYKSGIFNGNCGTGVNHAIVLVGYGYDATSDSYFYIVRNSWGSSWGEQGYMRVLNSGTACWINTYGYQASIA